MSPSPFPIYSPLPPTTNILTSEQRIRLVRSSRKVGSILGSTPYLVENDKSFMLPIGNGKPTSRALKRQGSIFTHHQTSSLSITSTSTASSHHHSPSASSFFHPQCVVSPVQSSESLPLSPPGLSTTRKCHASGKAPPLHLRINPVPFPPKDDYIPLSLSPTSSSCPPSPITPNVPNEAEIRRKQMAKLARHLGEHVPAELVFTSNSAPKRAPKSHRRSRSVIGIPAEDARVTDKKPMQQSKSDWVGEWNRSNIRDVQQELRNLRIR